MSEWIETYRGVVYPWHCDHLDHMNVQHYVGMFDQASWHLLETVGFSFADGEDRAENLVDAKHTIQYKVELRAGDLVKIESIFTRIGNKSLAFMHRMSNCKTGEVAATSEIVEVFFNMNSRTSMPIPDELRDKIAPHLVDV